VASFFGTVTTMIFFVTSGLSLWLMSTAGGVMTGAGAPALGAFNTELFPTEVRGTASGFLTVTAVAGSVFGLLAAGVLSDHLGLGSSIALLGIPCAIASLILIPLLPEPASRLLDEVSPPEV
jgi:MFS family permease